NSECPNANRGSETLVDKLQRQKRNSTDPPLRYPSPAQCERMWEHVDNQDVGLEAATIERVRNSLLVECEPAPIMQGGLCRRPKRGILRVLSSGCFVLGEDGLFRLYPAQST